MVFTVVFFTIGDNPFVIYLLVGSALFFTLYFGFPNIRYFFTSINVVRGKYDEIEKGDKNSDEGEVSHFQALATAVSGTVGNGNIAGVALAIALGGPGATFWMIVCGLLGMSTKFVECTLGVYYRDVDKDGVVYGGPMYYLKKGLKERGFDIGTTQSCVTPVYLKGSVPEAMALVKDLRENYRIFCSIVVYPVIPKGLILLRLIPTASHNFDDIEETLEAFSSIRERLVTGVYKRLSENLG